MDDTLKERIASELYSTLTDDWDTALNVAESIIEKVKEHLSE